METNKPTDQTGSAPARATRAGRNPADNLTQEDRVRGGQRSAGSQVRGPKGQFAGSVRRMGADARQNGDTSNHSGNSNGTAGQIPQNDQPSHHS
jgi:hypothetical protein